MPWRHKLSSIKLKTFSGYLGEYPGFDMNMKSCIFTHFGVISLVYLFVCMYISYKAHNRCTQETFLKGSDFDMNMVYALIWLYPRLLWNLSEKLCFEPSQIATVTNCDNSGIPAVAICDLSQFVIKAVTAWTESNNIENVFCVLERVPRFTFDRNLRDWVLTHFRIICHMYCV